MVEVETIIRPLVVIPDFSPTFEDDDKKRVVVDEWIKSDCRKHSFIIVRPRSTWHAVFISQARAHLASLSKSKKNLYVAPILTVGHVDGVVCEYKRIKAEQKEERDRKKREKIEAAKRKKKEKNQATIGYAKRAGVNQGGRTRKQTTAMEEDSEDGEDAGAESNDDDLEDENDKDDDDDEDSNGDGTQDGSDEDENDEKSGEENSDDEKEETLQEDVEEVAVVLDRRKERYSKRSAERRQVDSAESEEDASVNNESDNATDNLMVHRRKRRNKAD